MENERKVRIISLAAVIVAIIGLTIAFAAMSRTLKINGTGNVDPANFDIYFDNLSNPVTNGQAQTSGTPSLATKGAEISNINVTLKQPKDSVTYTVDIVNEGDVDAEISGITLPTLTNREQELFEFTAEYTEEQENGTHTISVGDMLYKNERKNITITFKYKDITDESKLPSNPEEITLSYAIQYVQSNKTKITTTAPAVVNNCTSFTKKDTYFVGDEIVICNTSTGKSEDFYVISDNGDTVTALAEWNLNVGDNKNPNVTEGIQDESVRGSRTDDETMYGTMAFSSNSYWFDVEHYSLKSNYGKSYPAFVFDSNSDLWTPVQNYQTYLRNTLGKTSVTVTLMSQPQAVSLGCDEDNQTCKDSPATAPSWVYQTSYWLGSAINDYKWLVSSDGDLWDGHFPDDSTSCGLRPVITINKSDL